MAELKTKANAGDVSAFLGGVDEERRADCLSLIDLMRKATGADPVMWGSSIIGFGSYHYKYESGREGDWMMTGFSPRKKDLTLYIMPGVEAYADLLSRLGKHKTGKSCLYIKKLADVDMKVLRELVTTSVARLRKTSSR